MSTFVYWIHHKEHTDIFSQGYIGVSDNIQRRWEDHKNGNTNSQHLKNAIKKYGWENLEKKIVIISDKSYCLQMEKQLRSRCDLGWNIVVGGGCPPNQTGKIRNSATINKLSGKNHWLFKNGHLVMGSSNSNFKGPILATNPVTGEQKMLFGARDIKSAGFTTTNVYSCLQIKDKMHKGYMFKRLNK